MSWADIGVIAALISTAFNWIYLWWRDHKRAVDFYSEIKYIVKDGKRVHGGGEELNLYLINKGAPLTIKGIFYDETEKKKGRKWHIPDLPKRLERGDILKIPLDHLPDPFNITKMEGIKKDELYPRLYALDSFNKLFVMKPSFRHAPPHQPDLSVLGKGEQH